MEKLYPKKKDKENPFYVKFNIKEKTIIALLFSSASIAIVVSAAIIYTLVEGSFSFFTAPQVNIFEFFFGTKWVPHGQNPNFGILPLLSGTFLIAGGTILIGAPLGIGAAIYLSEFASNRLRSAIKPIIEILAGIPSIVYGFFALMFISPLFRETFGAEYFNAISAIIVMSVMVLPIIVSISDDAMKAVPNHLRQSSLAIGATKWETATKVVMPAASSGIIAAVLLGLARAIGETMIVTLVAGSIAKLTINPFEEVMTMTSYIAKVATGDIPPGVAVSAGFAVGLFLFAITYLINMIAAQIVIKIKTGTSVKSKKNSKRKNIVSIFFSIIKDKFFYPIKLGILKVLKNLSEYTSKIKKKQTFTLDARYKRGKIGKSLIGSCLIFAIVFLIILVISILQQGIGELNFSFLTSLPSYLRSEKAGIYPAIIGSIYLMLLTILFSAPIGVGAAVYLNEFAHDTRYTRFLRRIIQNLAGVPSIVFGLMGFTIFVRMANFGPSLLSGSLTLTIMILPIIVVATEESLKSVPDGFREAAKGVGSTKWQTVRHHVLPNAIPGILTGIILSISRAIGETAPILFMAAAFSKTIPTGILDGFLALPTTIFYWTTDAKTILHDKAASTILVLLAILLAMNAIAIIIRQRSQAKRDW